MTRPAYPRWVQTPAGPLTVAVLLLATACAGPPAPGSPAAPSATFGSTSVPSEAQVRGELVLLAAASLHEAVTELAAAFERAQPGVSVVTGFGPSSGLAAQIEQGAPADVFASAGPAPVQRLAGAGEIDQVRGLATNELALAVPTDNPAGVVRLQDLRRRDVAYAICQPQVPCGSAASALLARAGITALPATYEADVRAVLTKVRLGEVDAGLVYVTDVRAASDDVTAIGVPEHLRVSTRIQIASLRRSGNLAAARAFVAFAASAPGQAILRANGFGPA